MGQTGNKTDKAATTTPGVGGAANTGEKTSGASAEVTNTGADSKDEDQSGNTDAVKDLSVNVAAVFNEAPQWAKDLIESNQAVIKSNEDVVKAVDQFRDKGNELIQQIITGAINVTGTSDAVVKTPEVILNPKAKYVVAKGKQFADKDNLGKLVTEGTDVSKLDRDRLQFLLSQGIIEEKAQEKE